MPWPVARAADAQGQGLVLARSALSAWDLIFGRLVRPFDLALPVPDACWIVCPRATAKLPKIAKFRDWLLAEAEEAKLAGLRRPRGKGAA